MIKLQLYNVSAGTLTVTPDAQGTEDFEQTLKRSDLTDGIVFEYTLDLRFNKQAKAYLRDVFDLAGGIEAIVIVNAFEYKPNAFRWGQIGSGIIKYTNADIDAETFKTSIDQTGFQTKVLNLLENDLDLDTVLSQGGLDIPETPFVNLNLHSKKILKETNLTPAPSSEPNVTPVEYEAYQQLNVFAQEDLTPGHTYRERIMFGTFDSNNAIFKEIDDSFALNWGWADMGGMGVTGPASIAVMKAWLLAQSFEVPDPHINVIGFKEAAVVDVDIDINMKHSITTDNPGDIDVCGDAALGEIEIRAWYELRDKSNAIKALENFGEFAMPNCGDRSDSNISDGIIESKTYTVSAINIASGDKLYVYETVRIYGDYDNTGFLGSETVNHHFTVLPAIGMHIQVKALTSAPASSAKAYLTWEALNKTFQYYTDQKDCFDSKYFGRTDTPTVYAVDGPGSLRAILSGANIRKVLGKTTFVNGKDFFGALNAIDCLGMGFETRAGRQVVVIEPLSYFYNKDFLILDLGPVSDLHRIVDAKQYSNSIELNYGKIDIQKTNGIDDVNQLRRWNYPITQVQTKQLATTKYKVSPYEIEDQRRLISSTEDSKNDDNNFFIDLIRNIDSFQPRKLEGYTLVEGIVDPPSIYNLNLSPRHNLDNWLQVVAISLYKAPDKSITFASGEGNYIMVSQKAGELPKVEGGAGVKIDLTSVAPLYMPERYKFQCPLSSDQMDLIKANPYGYLRFQEFRGGPNLEGYLSKVTRAAKKKLGTFELLKVFR